MFCLHRTPATTTSFELSDSAGDSPCMTTSSKPSNGGLTDSAKVRWTASLQSLVTAVSAKSSRRSKTNKVHASPKSGFGSSSGSGHGRSKIKSRHNSNSADGDLPDSAKARVASSPTSAFSKATAATTTTTTNTSSSGVNNVDSGNGGALETVRRKSVTFGELLEGVPVVPTAAAAVAGDAGSSSPKNANSARGANAHKDVSPRPGGGASAGAGAGANAGNSPTASPTSTSASVSAISARSSALPPSTSSQRRGSKDIVIWSNDPQPSQQTSISPKNANHSPKNATTNNNNKNFHGHNNGHNSNTSTPASTARTGMNGENKDISFAAFNDKLAFVPHGKHTSSMFIFYLFGFQTR